MLKKQHDVLLERQEQHNTYTCVHICARVRTGVRVCACTRTKNPFDVCKYVSMYNMKHYR